MPTINHNTIYAWLYVHKTVDGLIKSVPAFKRWGRGPGKVWMQTWDEYPLTVPVSSEGKAILVHPDSDRYSSPLIREEPEPVEPQHYDDYKPAHESENPAPPAGE